MALTVDELNQVRRGLARYASEDNITITISKSEWYDAVEDADSWLESAQSSFNNALPEPAKSELSANQKAVMLSAICARRVSLAFLKALLGEVD